MKNRMKQELATNVLKQSITNEKYFIIRNGKNIGFKTLKMAKESQKKGEDIYNLQVGNNGSIYTKKVTW